MGNLNRQIDGGYQNGVAQNGNMLPNLNSTLVRQSNKQVFQTYENKEIDSEEDDFEDRLDAYGTMESSVFHPGTILRQTSHRENEEKLDFQSELAQKLGRAVISQTNLANQANMTNLSNININQTNINFNQTNINSNRSDVNNSG